MLAGAALVFAGCAHSNAENGAPSRAAQSPTAQESKVHPGVRCTAWRQPGSGPDPGPGVLSYRLSDIGGPGVPALTAADMADVHRVARSVRSPTLRFVVLQVQTKLGLLRQFYIFDATSGPCYDGAPGYPILNDHDRCVGFYEPGENPYVAHAGPGDVCTTPVP